MEKKEQDEIDKLGFKESAGYKNLVAVLEYAKTTREMFRVMQGENKRLLDQVKQQNLALESLKTQIQQLQIKLYQNRATT